MTLYSSLILNAVAIVALAVVGIVVVTVVLTVQYKKWRRK